MRIAAISGRTADGRPFQIRSLRASEAGLLLDQLWELQVSDPAFHVTEPDEFNWTADRLRGRIEALNRAPNGLYIAVFADEGIVGSLSLAGGQHKKTAHAAVLGMGVRRGWRRQGLGRRLVEVACDAARTADPQHIAVLTLTVFSTNEPAQRLYASLGFAEEGRGGGTIRIDGRDQDVILMAKRLS